MKRALLVLLLAFAWVACGDDGTDLDGNVSGRFELRTVNGGPLPYTVIAIGNERLEILSGFLQANTDQSYQFSLTSRVTQGSQSQTTTDTDNGTWAQTGNQLTFTSSADGSQQTAVSSGNELIAIVEGFSLVFRK